MNMFHPHTLKRISDDRGDKTALPLSPLDEATPSPAKPGRRRGRRLLLLAGIAVVLAAAGDFGWQYWTVGRFQVSTDDAYVEADSTIIAPKVSGYLSEVLVQDNEQVKAGQPLARIDDRDYLVAVQQASADVAAAQADIANTQASLVQQQAVIGQARATVEVDQANLVYAQQNKDRFAILANKGAGSVQDAQLTQSQLDAAKATLARDGAAVDAAVQQQAVLQAQLDKAKATLAHDQAVLDQAKLNLGYTTIVAPIDGVVGDRSLRVGQYVNAGTQLMAVVPLAGVYIVANFKETQLTDVRAGQPVTVEVDTFPDAAIHGHVDSLAPASGQEFALLPPDNATGNFTKVVQRIPVKIVLDADPALAGLLRPGMSVEPTIDTHGTTQH